MNNTEQKEESTNDIPKHAIYVACLASHNAGKLYGKWIDATQEVSDIKSEIQEMLENSSILGANQFMIYDHNGFGTLGSWLCEYPYKIEEIRWVALLLEQWGELAEKLIIKKDFSVEEAMGALENDYIGVYESVAYYVEESMIERHEIPDYLDGYIDYEKMGRDWEGYRIFTINTGHNENHIFCNT